MANQRAARVANQMREELSTLIRNLKDPRVGFASIVKVDVSGDMRHAKAFISVLGNEQQKKETMKGLQSATGYLRTELSRVMQLRYTPELHFALDDSIEHGTRIAQLLIEVKKEQEEKSEVEHTKQ